MDLCLVLNHIYSCYLLICLTEDPDSVVFSPKQQTVLIVSLWSESLWIKG